MESDFNLDKSNVALMLTYRHKYNIDMVPSMLPKLCFFFFFLFYSFFFFKNSLTIISETNIEFMLICQPYSTFRGGGGAGRDIPEMSAP